MRIIFSIALLLAAPLAAHAQTIENPAAEELVIEGVNLTRDVACNGQNVGIYGASNQVALTGVCGMVILHGDSHVLILEQAEHLAITGAGHKVDAESLAGLDVGVADNTVTATIAAQAKPAVVSVNGAGHALALTLASHAELGIDGTNHVVDWSLAEGTPEPAISLGGIDNAVNRVN